MVEREDVASEGYRVEICRLMTNETLHGRARGEVVMGRHRLMQARSQRNWRPRSWLTPGFLQVGISLPRVRHDRFLEVDASSPVE